MVSKLEQFANQATVSPVFAQTGNTPFAIRYAQELKDVVLRYAARLPRNVQRHLGPSELGEHCSRKIVGKMAGVQFGGSAGAVGSTYVWSSVVGTALHAFMEEAFTWDAEHGLNPGRWLTERRVTPDPGAASPHPGTADMFDNTYNAVVDWKMQSDAVRTRLRRDGLPYHYLVQMLLYAMGYMHLGFPVDRIVLVSWPRTKSTLEDMYVLERVISVEDLRLVREVFDQTADREKLAAWVAAGEMSFWDVPPTPSDESCQFCSFSNPAALQDGTSKGCPGMSLLRK